MTELSNITDINGLQELKNVFVVLPEPDEKSKNYHEEWNKKRDSDSNIFGFLEECLKDGLVLVIRKSETKKIIAFLTLHAPGYRKGCALDIDRIQVLPEYRRQGIGRRLIKSVEAVAKRGKTGITARAIPDAYAFWKKCGFINPGGGDFIWYKLFKKIN
jgi:GNAT superfamily N-acetyltransferase